MSHVRRFCFRLALALGMTVRQLLDSMTAQELSEWMAYARIEPFDQRRGDARAAIVACTIANAHRGKGRRFKPKDFMLEFEDRKPQSMEEQIAILKAVTSKRTDTEVIRVPRDG